MHIGKKILDDIKSALNSEYHVDLTPEEYGAFTTSVLDNRGKVNSNNFKKRQSQSIQVIEKILKYHGKEDLLCFLKQLAIVEPNIQELQPRVRDHIVHTIYTFFIGIYILKRFSIPEKIRLRYDLSFVWKLTGTTHDLGYLVEIARNIQNPFIDAINGILSHINVNSPKINDSVYPNDFEKLCNGRSGNDLIQKRLSEWALDIDIFDYYEWLKNENRTDHGVIGALTQLKILDALYQRNNPHRKKRKIVVGGLDYNENNFILDLTSASAALFIHNIDLDYCGFKNKINFQLAPFAFLLFLCDTFQEWDRYSKNRDVYSGEDFDIKCLDCSIELSVPDKTKDKVFSALHQRLSGLTVKVNGIVAVS